jgi:hypothetical protein
MARAFAVAACAALLLAACGGGGDADPTPAVTVVETVPFAPTPVVPGGDPGVTVEQAVRACQEKNAELMQTFVTADVPIAEIDALFATDAEVRLSSRTLPVTEDGSASVDVVLEVTLGGDVALVEDTWELAQGDDGIWRLTALPACFG